MSRKVVEVSVGTKITEKEIQDKIFKILCEHTGVVPYTIEITDDLTTIMDSVDIVAFAMDIDKEFKLNNVSIEDVKPLTINTIVKEIIEQEKRGPKYKTPIEYTDFSKLDKDDPFIKALDKRRQYYSSDFVSKYMIPDLHHTR